MEDALGIQAWRTKKMGLEPLYADTLPGSLRLNFPGSRYIAEAESLQGSLGV